jgi:hypothetical protein
VDFLSAVIGRSKLGLAGDLASFEASIGTLQQHLANLPQGPPPPPNPGACVSALSLDFGTVSTISSATQSVTLTSSGTSLLTFAGVELGGPDPSPYSSSNNCPATLQPGDSCTISITFTPTQVGSAPAAAAINGSPGALPITIDLFGTGQMVATSENLALSTAGSGSGSVTPSPVGSTCGANCYSYDSDTQVEVSATAASGSTFVGWSGDCQGTGGCAVIMTSNMSVTANFAPTEYLTLGTAGTGSGSVSPSPVGSACGSGCYSYLFDTQVAVSASAASGSTFTSWSGDCGGTGGCSVTMDSNKSVIANFTANTTGGGLTGTWNGSMTTSYDGCVFSGTMSWTLTQTGNNLSGGYSYDGTTLTSGDPDVCGTSTSYNDTFTGSVSGNAITLTGDIGEAISATVNGNVIQGTMTYGTAPNITSWTYNLNLQP